MDYSKICSKRLRSLCKANKKIDKKKTTQDDLARKLNVSRQTISSYMNENLPPVQMLTEIADYFNVSVDYLLGRSEVASRGEDIQNASKFTGLSENALLKLQDLSSNGLSTKILSFLIVEGYISDILLSIKDSIIAREQFRALYGNADVGDQMDITMEYRFQQLAVELYRKAQECVNKQFSKELEQEISRQKEMRIEAAKEAHKQLEAFLREEGAL